MFQVEIRTYPIPRDPSGRPSSTGLLSFLFNFMSDLSHISIYHHYITKFWYKFYKCSLRNVVIYRQFSVVYTEYVVWRVDAIIHIICNGDLFLGIRTVVTLPSQMQSTAGDIILKVPFNPSYHASCYWYTSNLTPGALQVETNLQQQLSRRVHKHPRKSWKVMELKLCHGKSWNAISVMENHGKVMEFNGLRAICFYTVVQFFQIETLELTKLMISMQLQQMQYNAPNLMYVFQKCYGGDNARPPFILEPRIVNYLDPFRPKFWLHPGVMENTNKCHAKSWKSDYQRVRALA